MPTLVADCPRCGAQKMTFDVRAAFAYVVRYGWQNCYESFCICRHCGRATIFILVDDHNSNYQVFQKIGIMRYEGALNDYARIDGFVNISDLAAVNPPEHLPKEINEVFVEGAKCFAIGCNNAAGTMFRLCIDFATREKLPAEGNADGPNAKTRRDLGLRLPWLFDHGLLPGELRALSACVREDGNDGAHAGTLTKDDAADLLDFTSRLLDRMYTEPARVKIAEARREARRDKGSSKPKGGA